MNKSVLYIVLFILLLIQPMFLFTEQFTDGLSQEMAQDAGEHDSEPERSGLTTILAIVFAGGILIGAVALIARQNDKREK